MTQKIKMARVFVMALPADINTLEGHLDNCKFVEPLASQVASSGFVPVPGVDTVSLAAPFPGGVAFAVRFDEKVIPKSVLKEEVQKEVDKIAAETGRKPGKKEKADIKEMVLLDMAAQAFVKTTIVTVYYETATGRLYVPVASSRYVNRITSLIVEAVESVKTETIHVNSVTKGLTARLKDWLETGDDAFGEFHPCNEVQLESAERRIKVKMTGLQQAQAALRAALEQGFTVQSLGLDLQGTMFTLNNEFVIRSLNWEAPEVQEGDEDLWAAQIAFEVSKVSEVVTGLVELFAYDEGEEE